MEDGRFKAGFQGEECGGEGEMKGVWRVKERGNGEVQAEGGGGGYNEVLWVSGGRSHCPCQPPQPGSVQMVACNQEVHGP